MGRNPQTGAAIKIPAKTVVNFRLLRDLKFNAFLTKTQTPGLSGDDGAGQLEVQWRGGLFRFIGSYLDIQKNYNPEMGFVRRPGRRIIHNQFAIVPRLRRDSRFGAFIRDIVALLISDYAILPNGETETKYLRSTLRFEFQDGSIAEGQYVFNFERLKEPFVIGSRAANRLVIPIGDYKFNEFLLWYSSNPSKVFSFNARYQKGDFYGGSKHTMILGGKFQPGYPFSTELDYERNDIALGAKSLDTDLVQLRVNYAFNPSMFLNALIQYNSDTGQISSNIRFRLIHHALSDLFIVYNDLRDVRQERSDRSITLKYTHLLNF